MTALRTRPERAAAPPAAVHGPRLARRRRRGTVVVLLAVLVLAAGLAQLSIGDLQVSLVDVVRTLAGHGTSLTNYLIDTRLPRVEAALIAGAALGLAGAIFQCLLRNPLASPDILGVTSGAGLATVTGTTLFSVGALTRSLLAFGGAVAAAALIAALAHDRRAGAAAGQRFVVTGIGVAAMITAALGYVITRADVTQAQVALSSLVGGVGNADQRADAVTALALAVLVCALVPAARCLGVLQLGEDTAAGLGVRVGRRRALLLAIAVLLAAVGVGAAGPLAFVSLMAGPIARRLTRDGSTALVASALVGALVVLLADLAGQHLLPGTELPAGVLTGVIGAPYLLWLLTNGERAAG